MNVNHVRTHSPALTLRWPSVPTPATVPSEPWQKSPEEVVPLLVPESVHQRSEGGGRQKKVRWKRRQVHEEERRWKRGRRGSKE